MSKNHLANHRQIGQAIKANRDPTWWSSSRVRLRQRMHRALRRASRRAMKRDGKQRIEEALEEMREST